MLGSGTDSFLASRSTRSLSLLRQLSQIGRGAPGGLVDKFGHEKQILIDLRGPKIHFREFRSLFISPILFFSNRSQNQTIGIISSDINIEYQKSKNLSIDFVVAKRPKGYSCQL